MKFISKNWLVILSGLIILFVGIMTVVKSGKTIAVSTFSYVKEHGSNVELLKGTISEFEGQYTNHLYGKSYFVECFGLFNKVLNKKIILDNEDRYTVYKMNNGMLSQNYIGYDTTSFSQNYVLFSEKMDSLGIPLLYVQAPFKVDKYDNELPYGVGDETNLLADSFLQGISDKCKTLDLREEIHNQGLNYSSLFYSTDHHWKAETGLWASGVLAGKLIEFYGLDLNISHLSKDNYNYTVYEDYFLGSLGKRTGISYSGLDDFVLIEPRYVTNYQVLIPALDLVREGAYSDSVLFKEYMGRNYFEDDPGRVYTGDNYSLMMINNLISSNDTKLLLIKDSFSKSVIPSFASTCKELHIIDLRTFEGSVSEYAMSNDIDCVVVMYNPSVVVNPEFFNLN